MDIVIVADVGLMLLLVFGIVDAVVLVVACSWLLFVAVNCQYCDWLVLLF